MIAVGQLAEEFSQSRPVGNGEAHSSALGPRRHLVIAVDARDPDAYPLKVRLASALSSACIMISIAFQHKHRQKQGHGSRLSGCAPGSLLLIETSTAPGSSRVNLPVYGSIQQYIADIFGGGTTNTKWRLSLGGIVIQSTSLKPRWAVGHHKD